MNSNQIFSKNIKDTFLLHIPHSSKEIPFLKGYVGDYEAEIVKLTDWKTEEIFDVIDIDKLIFEYSRVFCDVERFADDDKEPMAKYGMGFFYTHTDSGKPLRQNVDNIKQKIYEDYYLPHHRQLYQKVKRKLDQHSVARIIDCHSFSNEPFLRDLDKTPNRPDICIGTDQFHTPDYLLKYAVKFFEGNGFSVKINSPYAGSIVPIEFYQKNEKVESLMIEINRKLYMSNDKVVDFKVNNLKSLITDFFKFQ